MTIERGSQAYQLVQILNAETSPPDHEGTLLLMALLLKPIYRDGYSPRRV